MDVTFLLSAELVSLSLLELWPIFIFLDYDFLGKLGQHLVLEGVDVDPIHLPRVILHSIEIVFSQVEARSHSLQVFEGDINRLGLVGLRRDLLGQDFWGWILTEYVVVIVGLLELMVHVDMFVWVELGPGDVILGSFTDFPMPVSAAEGSEHILASAHLLAIREETTNHL